MGPKKFFVRKVGVLATMRISFFLFWLVGLFGAVLYGALFLLAFQVSPEAFRGDDLEPWVEVPGGAGAVFVVIGGFFGSVVVAVLGSMAMGFAAAVYNFLSRVIGGFTLELEEDPLRLGPIVPSETPPSLPPRREFGDTEVRVAERFRAQTP